MFWVLTVGSPLICQERSTYFYAGIQKYLQPTHIHPIDWVPLSIVPCFYELWQQFGGLCPFKGRCPRSEHQLEAIVLLTFHSDTVVIGRIKTLRIGWFQGYLSSLRRKVQIGRQDGDEWTVYCLYGCRVKWWWFSSRYCTEANHEDAHSACSITQHQFEPGTLRNHNAAQHPSTKTSKSRVVNAALTCPVVWGRASWNCSLLCWYKCIGGRCCFHFCPWWRRPCITPKHWCPRPRLHSPEHHILYVYHYKNLHLIILTYLLHGAESFLRS